MRRSTFLRDLIGTTIMFGVLVGGTLAFMLVEHWLDIFKSH
jgi:hypothetical protein